MNRKAFTSLCVAIFVAMLGMGIISPLMPIYTKTMNASIFWLGFMYSGFSLSRALIQPFTGWFSDRRGRKMLLVVGLGAYTVISIGYALAQNIVQLAVVRLAHGVASAMVVPVAQAYVGDLCPKGKEGQTMGLFMMAMYLGMAGGPLLGGTVAERYNMNLAFYIMAVLAGFGLLLLILFVPNIESHAQRTNKEPAPVSEMLKDNKVKAVAVYLGSRGVFRQGISAFLPLYAVEVMHLNLTLASAIVSIYILAEAFGQGLVGPIADRFPRKTLMIFAAILAPIIAFFVPGMGTVPKLIAILVPIALITVVGRVPALAYNVEIGAKYGRMGVGMGITNAAQDLGHFFGPMVLGWTIDRNGYGSFFPASAVICLIFVPPMIYWLLKKEPEVAPMAIIEPAATDSE
jgi:DHA1 family multidrug resistance protein-like MFS transporter